MLLILDSTSFVAAHVSVYVVSRKYSEKNGREEVSTQAPQDKWLFLVKQTCERLSNIGKILDERS